MAKRKEAPLEPQKYAVGETVLILRPHLWSRCCGEVVAFANGLHRVKIEARDKETYPNGFHTDVPGSQLEPYL